MLSRRNKSGLVYISGSQSERNRLLGAILRARGEKISGGNGGAKQHKGTKMLNH